MNWNKITDPGQLQEIKKESSETAILIFKHSTRCSISSTALGRLERSWNDTEAVDVKPYFLDLISFREISNQIEKEFNVVHESPQILMIKDGVCTYTASHMGINYKDIISKAS